MGWPGAGAFVCEGPKRLSDNVRLGPGARRMRKSRSRPPIRQLPDGNVVAMNGALTIDATKQPSAVAVAPARCDAAR
jgi:hypothetical protein